MIVYHVALQVADDAPARSEQHRRSHLERVLGLRAAGIVIGGGPAPDGRTADLFYRLQRPEQIPFAIEEDPYWTARVWTRYTPRSFAQFVEPWDSPALVTDGSRVVTIVEGPARDLDMAQFALVEMRGAGRLAFGGFFEGGETLALARTTDPTTALGWFSETGFWETSTLRARPLLHVL